MKVGNKLVKNLLSNWSREYNARASGTFHKLLTKATIDRYNLGWNLSQFRVTYIIAIPTARYTSTCCRRIISGLMIPIPWRPRLWDWSTGEPQRRRDARKWFRIWNERVLTRTYIYPCKLPVWCSTRSFRQNSCRGVCIPYPHEIHFPSSTRETCLHPLRGAFNSSPPFGDETLVWNILPRLARDDGSDVGHQYDAKVNFLWCLPSQYRIPQSHHNLVNSISDIQKVHSWIQQVCCMKARD